VEPEKADDSDQAGIEILQEIWKELLKTGKLGADQIPGWRPIENEKSKISSAVTDAESVDGILNLFDFDINTDAESVDGINLNC
jgi:hypothetical protein